jgi:photosystem II stability/assembly factor-like uncharacterized protein
MRLIAKLSASALPFVIIGGLWYAAIYIKPQARGRSVEPPAVARGDFIYGIAAAPTGSGVLAAGSEGKVWRGTADGASWRVLPTPTRANLQDIAAWDSMHAVAVGNDGVVIITDDGGDAWRQVDAPRSPVANKLMRVRTDGDSEAWAVGEMGAVLHSTDFGASWVRSAPEQDAAWNDVHVYDGKVWLAGEFGRIAYSVDGGASWHRAASPVEASLMAISFRDPMNGIAVGVEGIVLLTGDGGAHWTEAQKPTAEHLFDVAWDGANWIVVGDKGQLLKGDALARHWEVLRASANERGWHTKVLTTPTHYLMAGENYRVIAR